MPSKDAISVPPKNLGRARTRNIIPGSEDLGEPQRPRDRLGNEPVHVAAPSVGLLDVARLDPGP